MNSWDAWDTLLARRSMRDEVHHQMRAGRTFEQACEIELANLIPIMENIQQVQKEDIVVSDYGDGDLRWNVFLEKALKKICDLLYVSVIVTPDGKHRGTIWEKLPSVSRHYGDHPHADVTSPRKHGIEGILVQRSLFSKAEEALVGFGFPVLARVCREARLRTWTPEYRGIELLQTDYNFPTLFLASILLNRWYPTETLLMSGRDCYQWYMLMSKMYRRGVYWQSSVIARTMDDPNYARYTYNFGPDPALVDLSGSGESFARFAAFSGIAKSILAYRPTGGNSAIRAMVTSPACMRLEQANVAPAPKCVGVTANLEPIFLNRDSVDYSKEPNTQAQIRAFGTCLAAMDHYDLSREREATDGECQGAMTWLMHRYFDFAPDVEQLRLLAMREDRS